MMMRRTRFRRAPLNPFAPRFAVNFVEARSRGIPASVVSGRTSRTALVSPADSSRPGTAGAIKRGGIPGTGLCGGCFRSKEQSALWVRTLSDDRQRAESRGRACAVGVFDSRSGAPCGVEGFPAVGSAPRARPEKETRKKSAVL